jgi:hypothetical protein
MADDVATGTVLAALVAELAEQGFGPADIRSDDPLTTYSVHGTLDVQALAEAVESALGGGTMAEAKAPAELNAANDG